MNDFYVGARVRIEYGEVAGETGTIYNCDPGRPAPWQVRPDSWPADVPGIALRAEELELLPGERRDEPGTGHGTFPFRHRSASPGRCLW